MLYEVLSLKNVLETYSRVLVINLSNVPILLSQIFRKNYTDDSLSIVVGPPSEIRPVTNNSFTQINIRMKTGSLLRNFCSLMGGS